MAESITSDVLRAQIAELRQRLKHAERERDAYASRALVHAQEHRAYKRLARSTQDAISRLREGVRSHEIRICDLARKLEDVLQGIGSGKVVVMRPPLGVTRPPNR